MRYFTDCKTAEELKKAYRTWAKKLHPDLGGNAEEFKVMQAEYERMWERLKNVHKTAKGKTYTAKTETAETPQEFITIINVLIKLEGVQTEICGNWIWCSGNTMTHKHTLKHLGFKWAHKKKAWYYHTEPYKKKSHRELTLDEIREMFGSQSYAAKAEEEKKLTAAV